MIAHSSVPEFSPDVPSTLETLRQSPAMREITRIIEQVADTDATVLIRGESGVGKEVVAKAVHSTSKRRAGPFVKVNCAALPSELLESELFGHEKGAFTGAYQRKIGKFLAARSGTMFLDEIGDMPLALQAKLLHVLQDQEFVPVGGTEVITAETRVIASTNRNLESAIREGQFREDLYYRLKVVSIHVPALRQRREEIPSLARMFVERLNKQWGRRMSLSHESLVMLAAHSWPGNVRELENMMKRVVVMQREALVAEELSPVPGDALVEGDHVAPVAPVSIPSLRELGRRAALEAQREAIRDVLQRVNWNRAEAARLLNISYKGLLYKIDQCGLGRKRQPKTKPAA